MNFVIVDGLNGGCLKPKENRKTHPLMPHKRKFFLESLSFCNSNIYVCIAAGKKNNVCK